MIQEKIKAPKAAKKVAPIATTTASTMSVVTENTVKRDYGRDNLFTLMLQVLFMATGAPSPFQAFAALIWSTFEKSEFYADFVTTSCTPPNGIPYLEQPEGKLQMTAAGRKLATTALKASFETKKGINASQVVKESTTNYLLAVGGELFSGGIRKMLEKADENFVATPQLRAGMIPLISDVINFSELLGVTDEVLEATLNCYLSPVEAVEEAATTVQAEPVAA